MLRSLGSLNYEFGGFLPDCLAPSTYAWELGTKNCTPSTLRPILDTPCKAGARSTPYIRECIQID